GWRDSGCGRAFGRRKRRYAGIDRAVARRRVDKAPGEPLVETRRSDRRFLANAQGDRAWRGGAPGRPGRGAPVGSDLSDEAAGERGRHGSSAVAALARGARLSAAERIRG